MTRTIRYYSDHAEEFARLYDSLCFETAHSDWLELLPAPGSAVDIGAGSGRDARYLARRGFQLTAVEPAANLRHLGEAHPSNGEILWLDDSLPYLTSLHKQSRVFDLVLVSAVWMHLDPSVRKCALDTLTALLNPGGLMVITLRHGPSQDDRVMHPVTAAELEILAKTHGLVFKRKNSPAKKDLLLREGVSWETVLLTTA